MWKKNPRHNALLSVHEGDIISQYPFSSVLEFAIQTIEKEYLSVLKLSYPSRIRPRFEKNGFYVSTYL
jgi:hypothetical protein